MRNSLKSLWIYFRKLFSDFEMLVRGHGKEKIKNMKKVGKMSPGREKEEKSA